jgi:uncharacterized paraquat-inducible protein A
MMEEGYSDSTIRMTHWGNQRTAMLSTYAHVSNKSIDDEILGRSGLTDLKKKERKPVNQCDKCHVIVKPTDEYCPRCSNPLTEAAIEKVSSQQAILRAMIKEEIAKLI